MRSLDKILLFFNVEINKSNSHMFDDFPIMEWLPIYIELEIKDETGEIYFMDLSNIMDYDEKDVGIDKKWLNDFPTLNKSPNDIDILPVLTKLNNIEYERLNIKIDKLQIEYEKVKNMIKLYQRYVKKE